MASDGTQGRGRRERRARQKRRREVEARLVVGKLGLLDESCSVLVLRLVPEEWPYELEPRQWKRLSDAMRRQHGHGLGDAFTALRRPDIGLLGSRGYRELRYVVVEPATVEAWRVELGRRRSYGFELVDVLLFEGRS